MANNLASIRPMKTRITKNTHKKKGSRFVAETTPLEFGTDLLSRLPAVPSARAGFTALFGMVRGGSPPL